MDHSNRQIKILNEELLFAYPDIEFKLHTDQFGRSIIRWQQGPEIDQVYDTVLKIGFLKEDLFCCKLVLH